MGSSARLPKWTAPLAMVVALGCSNDYALFGVSGSSGAATGGGGTATTGPGGGGSGASSSGGSSNGGSANGGSSNGGSSNGGSSNGGSSNGGSSNGGSSNGGSSNGGSSNGGSSNGGGGMGGMGPVCGDGTIDPNEECDPGPGPTLGCSDTCEVECDGDGEVYDPSSGHCYYRDINDGILLNWGNARQYCQNTFEGDLLVLEAMPEYDFLLMSLPKPNPHVFFWVGAEEQGQGFVWVDGTPVSYPANMPPWMDTEPSGNGDRLIWRADDTPSAEGLGDLPAGDTYHPFCERPPPGNP